MLFSIKKGEGYVRNIGYPGMLLIIDKNKKSSNLPKARKISIIYKMYFIYI